MAKMVKCPECGEEFKKPLFGQKDPAWGLHLLAIGDLVCPKCNYKGHTSAFVEAEKESSSPK